MLSITTRERFWLAFLATRPWSFSMTAISVTLGSIAAPRTNLFDWTGYGLALLGMIFVHAATNVLNDFFDFRDGVDKPGSPTTLYRRHPLVEKDFTPEFILGLSLGCYAGAAMLGLYFVVCYGYEILIFAGIGGVASIFYTASPVKYKHLALGELVVFFMWGPLMMSASHFIQTSGWNDLGTVLLISIPQGLWVALVLLANNLKDIDDDRESKIRTLGTLLGRHNTMRLYQALVVMIYGLTLLEIVIGVIPIWGLLTLCSLPGIMLLIRQLSQETVVPSDADPRTAQTGMIYGLCLILALNLY